MYHMEIGTEVLFMEEGAEREGEIMGFAEDLVRIDTTTIINRRFRKPKVIKQRHYRPKIDLRVMTMIDKQQEVEHEELKEKIKLQNQELEVIQRRVRYLHKENKELAIKKGYHAEEVKLFDHYNQITQHHWLEIDYGRWNHHHHPVEVKIGLKGNHTELHKVKSNTLPSALEKIIELIETETTTTQTEN